MCPYSILPQYSLYLSWLIVLAFWTNEQYNLVVKKAEEERNVENFFFKYLDITQYQEKK